MISQPPTFARVVTLTGGAAEIDQPTLPQLDPPRHFGDLLTAVSERFKAPGGVLLVDRTAAPRYGLPDAAEPPDDLPAWVEAHSSGWIPGGAHKGWTKFRRTGHPDINVCLLSHQRPGDFPLLHGTPHSTMLALHCWHVMTGHPWFGTPGTAGSDVLETTLKALKPRGATFKPKKPGPPGRESAYLGGQWSGQKNGQVIHGYDANRMYLAGALVVDVAPWQLAPTGPIEFDRHLGGWWLIDVPPWNDPRLPNPAGYDKDNRRWVTTPTAALLADLAEEGVSAGFKVLDSYTGPSRRLFRGWANKMDGAYQRAIGVGAGRIAKAIKSAAARETLGLFNSPTYTTYRPDWYYSIVAVSRCNLFRKMRRIGMQTGRWPVRVETDCLWYSSSNVDASAACPAGLVLDQGLKLGNFKVKGTR